MDRNQINYYLQMKQKNRLIPFFEDGKLCLLLTFYIGNGNAEKFVRDNPWSIVSDDPKGDCCYVDQLIRNKHYKGKLNSFKIFYALKEFIKHNYPHIRKLRWNRWRNNKTNRREYGLYS